MLGGTMCELGIYNVSRPHTGRQREGGRDEEMEDVEKEAKKEERKREIAGRRGEGKVCGTPDIMSLHGHCDCKSAL